MNRRAFLERSSLAAAAALLPFPGRLIFAADDRLRALRGGTGVFTEKGGTIGWYVADGGVVVVDTQYPETAPHCLEAVRSRTARKIDAVLNTHHHGDHTGGNARLPGRRQWPAGATHARRCVLRLAAFSPDGQRIAMAVMSRQAWIDDLLTYGET